MNATRPSWIAFVAGAIFAAVPMLPVAQKLGDSSHWPMHLAAGFLLLGLLALAHRGSSSQSSLPNVSTWGVLLLLAIAVSGFWTVPLFAASEAKLAVGRYAGYAAAALIGWRFGLRALPTLAWGILGAAMIEGFSVLADFGQSTKAMADPYLAPGILGHKNFTSSAIALAIPAAWYLWGRSQSSAKNAALAVGILAMLAIVLLRTRSIWIGAALWLLFGLARNFRSWKPLLGAALLGLVLIAAVVSRPKIREALMDPTNLRIREVFWDHSLAMIKAAPWTGVGAGQWRIHFPGYGLQGMNPSVAEGITAEVRPHNDALWIASEQGLPGLAAWLLLWGGLLVSWFKSRREEGADLVAGLGIIVLTYSMFEFPLERAAVWIPFMLALGMLTPSRSSEAKRPNLWIASIAIAVMGLVYLNASREGLSSEQDQQELLALNERQDALRLLPAAIQSLDDWTELDRFGNPSPYFAGMSSMALEAQRGPISAISFAQARSYFEQSLELHPNHVVTWYQLGNLYRYQGNALEAESTYRKLLQRSPRHPGGQMHLAHSLLAQNRAEEAASVLFSAFGSEAYYQQADYRNAAIQALRLCPDAVKHRDVNQVLRLRAGLDDQALFEAFLAEKRKFLR